MAPGVTSAIGRALALRRCGGLLLFVGCHGTLVYVLQYVPTGIV
jgi:hypothetical protein